MQNHQYHSEKDVRDTITPHHHNVGAIIVAAGKSARMDGVDKVFASLAGKPMLTHVLGVFDSCPSVNQIVVVLNESNIKQGSELVKKQRYSKDIAVCIGGNLRQDSVAEGLKRLTDCRWVIIHDGARPCLSADLIDKGLREAKDSGAAIAAVPAKDTIKRVGTDMVIEDTPQREAIWMAQTPQIFRWEVITKAYRRADCVGTDDAALVEASGYKVKVYMGSYDNIKVTTPHDLAIAELILTQIKHR